MANSSFYNVAIAIDTTAILIMTLLLVALLIIPILIIVLTIVNMGDIPYN
jgi:hypothetical protein